MPDKRLNIEVSAKDDGSCKAVAKSMDELGNSAEKTQGQMDELQDVIDNTNKKLK